MFKELLWYIDNNRFLNLVEEIDSCAKKYEENFSQDAPEHKKSRRAFITLVNRHAKKSGYIKKLEANFPFNPDTHFFKNGKLDRKELDTFEKEVVKAHMYQKHLWDFMGTTSSFGIITRLGLASNKKNLDDYIPLSFLKRKSKSPISNILSQEKNAVPIYIYPDGSISTLYDKNISSISFDTTSDKSGFNWTQTGYDPNYTTLSSDTEIVYDEKNDCYRTVKRQSSLKNAVEIKLFEKEKPVSLTLSLIKTKEGVILFDPFYIFIYKKIKKAIEQKNKRALEDTQEDILSFIDASLDYLDRDKITSLILPPGEREDENILKFYKDTLKSRASTNLSFISLDNAKKEEEKTLAYIKDENDKKLTGELSSKISYLVSLGLTGPQLKNALSTNTMLQDMNIKSRSDLESIGLSDSDMSSLKSYNIDDSEQKELSKVLFNAFDIYPLFSSSMPRSLFVNEIYNQVVLKKPSSYNADISTTLKTFLLFNSTIFDQTPQGNILKQFEDEIAILDPRALTADVKKALDNAVLRYNIINRSLQMNPSQIVQAVIKIFDIQNSTITYKNASSPTNQSLMFSYPIKKIIEHSSLQNNKQSLKLIDYSAIKPQKGFKNTDESIAKYLSSAIGKKSLLDKAGVVSLLSLFKKRESAQPVNNVKLFENATFTDTRCSLNTKSVFSPTDDSLSSIDASSLFKNISDIIPQKSIESSVFEEYSPETLAASSLFTDTSSPSDTEKVLKKPDVEFAKPDVKSEKKQEKEEEGYGKSYNMIKEKFEEAEEKEEKKKEEQKKQEEKKKEEQKLKFRQSKALPQSIQEAQGSQALSQQEPAYSSQGQGTVNEAPGAFAESLNTVTKGTEKPPTPDAGKDLNPDRPGASSVQSPIDEYRADAESAMSMKFDAEIDAAAAAYDVLSYARYNS